MSFPAISLFNAQKKNSDEVKLRVNGSFFLGWHSVAITRELESLCGGFRLSLADKFIPEDKPLKFYPGDECEIHIGDDKIITGYIDALTSDLSASSRSLEVQGRDKTQDVVDCSTDFTGKQLIDQDFFAVAKKLCEPFGVKVKDEVGGFSKTKSEAINTGETAFEYLERQARLLGLFLITDKDSNVVITKIGQSRASTALKQGENVLSANVTIDHKDRFRTYKCKGQSSAFDRDNIEDVKNSFIVKATATDNGARSSRIKIVQAVDNVTPAKCKAQVEWLASVSRARSLRVTLSVPGWRQESGELWAINQIVPVELPFVFLDRDMLVSRLEFTLDAQGGSRTQLTLTFKDAFIPEPQLQPDPTSALDAAKK